MSALRASKGATNRAQMAQLALIASKAGFSQAQGHTLAECAMRGSMVTLKWHEIVHRIACHARKAGFKRQVDGTRVCFVREVSLQRGQGTPVVSLAGRGTSRIVRVHSSATNASPASGQSMLSCPNLAPCALPAKRSTRQVQPSAWIVKHTPTSRSRGSVSVSIAS